MVQSLATGSVALSRINLLVSIIHFLSIMIILLSNRGLEFYIGAKTIISTRPRLDQTLGSLSAIIATKNEFF